MANANDEWCCINDKEYKVNDEWINAHKKWSYVMMNEISWMNDVKPILNGDISLINYQGLEVEVMLCVLSMMNSEMPTMLGNRARERD